VISYMIMQLPEDLSDLTEVLNIEL
jgi:hypothetical protein